MIQAKRTLATAQELLRELTGESFDSVSPAPIEEMPLKSPDPEDDETVGRRGAGSESAA